MPVPSSSQMSSGSGTDLAYESQTSVIFPGVVEIFNRDRDQEEMQYHKSFKGRCNTITQNVLKYFVKAPMRDKRFLQAIGTPDQI